MPPRDKTRDIFLDDQGRPRVLRGVTDISSSTRIAELAGLVGFDLVWIELEHGIGSYTEVEHLCTATECAGALSAVRVQDHQRTHILRALECGARIVFVPMINTAEQAREIVKYGKFTPVGERGANTRSRAVDYGIGGFDRMLRANVENHLFAQIETPEGVRNVDEIVAVEGLAGIFIGPYDLSLAMGIPGQFSNPTLIDTIVECTRKARAAGKHVGIMQGAGKLLDAVLAAGCDMVVMGGDLAHLLDVWQKMIKDFDANLANIQAKS